MPRHDWNTPTAHTQKPRHAKLHSGAHGKGHDKKRQAEKRERSNAGRRGRKHHDGDTARVRRDPRDQV